MARKSGKKIRLVLGIVLLTLGLLALVYGGFSYTEDQHSVDLGIAEFSIEEKEEVSVPPWLGVVAIVGGVVLIALGRS